MRVVKEEERNNVDNVNVLVEIKSGSWHLQTHYKNKTLNIKTQNTKKTHTIPVRR